MEENTKGLDGFLRALVLLIAMLGAFIVTLSLAAITSPAPQATVVTAPPISQAQAESLAEQMVEQGHQLHPASATGYTR